MKYPYIGSDLDGTIVRNEDHKILDETVTDILNYQKLSNNKFFIVTGRMYEIMKLYIEQLEIKLPVISSNGAVITDPITKAVLYENNIDAKISLAVINFARENNLDLIFYTAQTIVMLKNSERVTMYKKIYNGIQERFVPETIELDSYHTMIQKVSDGDFKPVKLLFSFPAEGMENEKTQTLAFLDKYNLNHPTTLINNRFLVDAMNQNISKASGLIEWAKIMDVAVADIHVIGDNNNDLEMVLQSNYGIAVGNGVENLKANANLVIDHIDNNGVGQYLNDLVSRKK